MKELETSHIEDELILLATAANKGAPIDPDAVLMTLDRLFGEEEYDNHNEYVINIAGVVPESPGPIRDHMWRWIERMEKRLGISIEVWGDKGEYLTPATINGRTYGRDDFGQTDADEYCVEHDLAESLRCLAEFHRAWRIFASRSLRGARRENGWKKV